MATIADVVAQAHAAPLKIDGVPIAHVLARLNHQRGEPKGPKPRRNKPGQRAAQKAKARERAAQAYATQRQYETAFASRLKWSWREVERQLVKHGQGFKNLATFAATFGIFVEVAAQVAEVGEVIGSVVQGAGA